MALMAGRRLTFTLDPDLAGAVRAAARAEQITLSAWFTEVACRQLAARGLRDVVAEWESEHGAFSDAELAEARQRLTR